MRRAILAAIAVMAMLAVTGVAYADSCANVSRAPAACGFTCSSPVAVGNWVWLPSIGVGFPAWGFSPPGSITSQQLGLPHANGNYIGQSRAETSLLVNSAICESA